MPFSSWSEVFDPAAIKRMQDAYAEAEIELKKMDVAFVPDDLAEAILVLAQLQSLIPRRSPRGRSCESESAPAATHEKKLHIEAAPLINVRQVRSSLTASVSVLRIPRKWPPGDTGAGEG